ncbi:hypothetical protein GCM10010988_15920 [Cnuibacter physcomitrellae]|uniref:glycosyltransferase family 2 protein n=1 Tax=Cnuibacter physcomitrellae TaxID=1619308 RepID=UPI0019CE9E14|nr:glycosyltransferase family 2 protein [Cnuibacter physcomitrellae]GGI37826.1 hypothetical protein GCM10010988_15920 [Cnuibacter physcomitrellae]
MIGARRQAAEWARTEHPVPPRIDVLIPTAGRIAELAVTLAGLAAQDSPSFRVVLSDQSDHAASHSAPSVQAMVRVLEAQGHEVVHLAHLPRRGIAEHRQFLFEQSDAPSVLFLDDDIWLEPGSLQRMHDALETLACGFVGLAPQGLSFLHDERPEQRAGYEPWHGAVEPERMRPGGPQMSRLPLHNAANLVHLARDLEMPPDGWQAYHVAWIGGCVLYRRSALAEAGAFEFWRTSPPLHSGEDVAAEWRVMDRRGGAGLLPSGAVHLEAPTTIPDRPIDLFDLVFASDP